MTTLAERLGYGTDDRLLIINCDDLGASYATNAGTYAALREGIATSATLMVPAPWSREAAASYRGEDVGVQLTLNAEFELYRWGPITHAPSLLDGNGGFPRTVTDLWDHADLDETRRELRAQIERAIFWGFDVTHLSSHLGTLQFRPEFFDVYLDLAHDFALPLRLTGVEADAGFPFRSLAAEDGVVSPDHVVSVPGGPIDGEALVRSLSAGVTELTIHPAADTPELRAYAPDWERRHQHRELAVADGRFREALRAGEVHLIGYRALRQLQRANATG